MVSGDTLSGIASKYGVTIDQLKAWNKLSSTTIQAGQKLVVRPASTSSSSASSSTSAATSSSAAASSGSTTYTVRKGDTLGAIADRYNCTVEQLKAWNKLSSSTIYPGQKLKIQK